METAEFDSFGDSYREIHDRNLSFTGMNSMFFARQKAMILAGEERVFAGKRVLDLGCGDGALLHFLEELDPGAEYLGVDESVVSIEHATKCYPKIRFEVGNGFVLRFPHEYFDVVILACVVHHVTKAKRDLFFKEILRVLKKGGRVYVFEHNPLNPVTKFLVRTCVFDKGVSLVGKHRLSEMLRCNGFHVFQGYYYLFFPEPRTRFWLSLEKKMKWLPFGGQYFLAATKDHA
jgi:ubiquinone/menaquinone biosynthesis C-methylase UbiE